MIRSSNFNKGGLKILSAIRDECERHGALVGEIGGGTKAYASVELDNKSRKVFFSASPHGAILNRSRAARHRVKEALRNIKEGAA